MALDFRPDCPVLNFNPRSHVRWKSRQFLLWPALAYRVVAPIVQQRELNVLRRAVLGLSLAGMYRIEDIAENLAIHRDLAAFIMKELMGLGFIDSSGFITGKGVQILQKESLDTAEMEAGYVFQDPYAGDLWPRFVEKLDYCELEYNESGFPELIHGTRGAHKKIPAYTVLPKSHSAYVMPYPKAIVEAVRRQRKSSNFMENEVGFENNGEEVETFYASARQIESVSFVEDTPQPVFLKTFIYIPESDAAIADWYAADPFGLGQSVRLRRQMDLVRQKDPGLHQVVDRLFGNAKQGNLEDHMQWQRELRIQAELEVERRFSIDVRTSPVFDTLVAMEELHQEVNDLAEECPSWKKEDALRSGLKSMEKLFAVIASEYPLDDIWKRVYVESSKQKGKLVPQKDLEILQAIYSGAYNAIGCIESIPKSFLNIKPGQIRSVAQYGDNWRFRPMVAATALFAQQNPTHPLRVAVQKEPTLLDKLEEIAIPGARGGHIDDSVVTIEDVNHHINNVYEAVSLLLDVTHSFVS